MLNIKNITIKNFMSVGNVTQAVHFNTQPLTLVLGINVDLGGDDNRNGTGKTTIVNALSYALYGINPIYVLFVLALVFLPLAFHQLIPAVHYH